MRLGERVIEREGEGRGRWHRRKFAKDWLLRHVVRAGGPPAHNVWRGKPEHGEGRKEVAGDMATPLLAGLGVAAAAVGGKYAMQMWQSFRNAPPRLRQFYQGGFLPEMTRREASQILGLRESAPVQKVREAHRKIMVANHPDAGGSDYLASKINEAKDKLLKKSSGSSTSPF